MSTIRSLESFAPQLLVSTTLMYPDIPPVDTQVTSSELPPVKSEGDPLETSQ